MKISGLMSKVLDCDRPVRAACEKTWQEEAYRVSHVHVYD